MLQTSTETVQEKKELYKYQIGDLDKIFERLDKHQTDYNLLYQLPTGGGKTVIFSEIVRRYVESLDKKVVVLTHRIELCKQTSKMLDGFGVRNKIINSKIKDLPDQDDYDCFVAMVETLKNRLEDGKLEIDNVGLVIIDEAHYNSFRKLFGSFQGCFILGVTATPLSSNAKLPMKNVYDELIVGNTIQSLIEHGFLAKANMHSYNVGLRSLKIGANGDYTIKSSDELYSNLEMLDKLKFSYEEHAKGKKTLIFNNGIKTSLQVYKVFAQAGYPIKHLDNSFGSQERKEILDWFKHTPDAILTSVSLLTTGFDEPTVEAIILNRATKSLTLYFQMIGRGSRVLPHKKTFEVIDLGNNAARFGYWDEPVNWQLVFKSPDFYLESIRSDDEIENNFRYELPVETKRRFNKSLNLSFDVEEVYKDVIAKGLKTKTVLDLSIEQHAKNCVESADSAFEAKQLAKELREEILYRIQRYTYCLANCTKNYKDWLEEDYRMKLNTTITKLFAQKPTH
ncbi:MAG: DEAD/DEAH box helicase family protein [Flavobacteriales bacterium]|nr:DEAD/DEAH box helicase family protein [Flavobacteriales bacterium]